MLPHNTKINAICTSFRNCLFYVVALSTAVYSGNASPPSKPGAAVHRGKVNRQGDVIIFNNYFQIVENNHISE